MSALLEPVAASGDDDADVRTVEIVFARELPVIATGDGLEALVRARVEVATDERRHRWSQGPLDTVARATDPWPRLSLPDGLEQVLVLCAGSAPPRVWASAEAQSWLAKHAPRTFALLMQRTDLCQRDACYALVREGETVRFAWRSDGPVDVHGIDAPLFDVAHAAARGRLADLDADDDALPDALRLVRAHLVTLWSTGRLAPEQEWLAASREMHVRGGDGDTRLAEGADAGRSSVWLHTAASHQARELDISIPDDVPAAVVGACVSWLLANAADGELFLDPSGRHVRELL